MPRKTLLLLLEHPADVVASMRPRPDAAENLLARRTAARTLCRFNEAAARCRGKPSPRCFRPVRRWSGFNEAAARCRGKPAAACAAMSSSHLASMRPRPDAAENRQVQREGLVGPVRASMRPRPDAAENPARTGRRAVRLRRRFNEAAARCRGKPHRGSAAAPDRGRRFNEAAARCRGKPVDARQFEALQQALQ